jgi:hypothetical protein
MGQGSKAIITGDITQIDLPKGKKSGLVEAIRVLQGIKGLEFVYLTHRDVVRHELVMRIIEAYGRYDKKTGQKTKKDQRGVKRMIQPAASEKNKPGRNPFFDFCCIPFLQMFLLDWLFLG